MQFYKCSRCKASFFSECSKPLSDGNLIMVTTFVLAASLVTYPAATMKRQNLDLMLYHLLKVMTAVKSKQTINNRKKSNDFGLFSFSGEWTIPLCSYQTYSLYGKIKPVSLWDHLASWSQEGTKIIFQILVTLSFHLF